MCPRVVYVVGARPNYIKVAPVYAALGGRDTVEQHLVHTGQHYDALLKDVFFSELPLPRPDHELHVGSGSHGQQTAAALAGLEELFFKLQPDLVVVPGDVNSTLAGALAAVKLGIPVCHLEAGLRSFDRTMPEEHNRRLTDHVSTLLLTHSTDADENLRREGIADEGIRFVGNTMIDSLRAALPAAEEAAHWTAYGLQRGQYVLVTLHRPALVDDPALLGRTMTALERVGRTLPVLFPVHPRTRARLDGEWVPTTSTVLLVPPLPYHAFLSLEAGAGAVVTDSGGVQEETTALGVPCFTLRANTERPVTVTLGTNTILGLEPEAVVRVPDLLRSPKRGQTPPLWDGEAGARAADQIEQLLGVQPSEPVPIRQLRADDVE
jgi:UDP-N-acetylglucosamine 2-epimerase (non-hydrolysing)